MAAPCRRRLGGIAAGWERDACGEREPGDCGFGTGSFAGAGKQAATPGAGVAGPGVRRAVGPRPASASSPLPAPPAVPQADPVIPTAPAIAPVAVETHAGVAAGEALSAGSSPADQPSVSFDGAVSPRAGAAQALQRASDDRARPSQAAEDANHDDLPDQATPASTTVAEGTAPTPAARAASAVSRALQASAKPATAARQPAEATPEDAITTNTSGPTPSSRIHRPMANPGHPEPATTDREAGLSETAAPDNRADDPAASSVEPVGGELVSGGSAAVLGESPVIPGELLRSRERARARARVMREVAPKRGVVREGPASAGPEVGRRARRLRARRGRPTRSRCLVRRSMNPTVFQLIGVLG